MLKILSLLRGKNLVGVLFGLLFILIQSGAAFAIPFLLKDLLNILAKGAIPGVGSTLLHTPENAYLIALYIGLSFVAAIISLIFSTLAVIVITKYGVRYISEMRSRIFNKIQELSYSDIDKLTAASLITRITTDAIFLEQAIVFSLRFLARGGFMFIGGIISSIILSPTLSWILLGLVPLILIIVGVLFLKSMPWFKRMQVDIDNVNKKMRENILGVRVIKTYLLHDIQKQNFSKVNKTLEHTSEKAYTFLSVISPIITLIISVTTVAVIWIANSIVLSNREIFAELIPFIQVLQQVLVGLLMMIMVSVQLGRGLPSATRIKEVLFYKSSIKYGTNDKSWKDKKISFNNVSFAYSPTAANVIDGLNFEIHQGEKIGFIGKTGSGKSTLANLISRAYDVTKGSITIGDTNIKSFSKENINKNVAVAPQQAFLFSGTIRSNILLGIENEEDPKVEEKIIDAAKNACAWEFISQKEDGLNTIVEQRGNNFSGGQKQRLALARTIAKNANLIVLDESTSALDNFTEAKIKENIANNLASSMIIISQKVNSVKESDIIHVIDDGKIVDSGKHAELLTKNKFYYETSVFQLGQEEVDRAIKELGGVA